MMPCVVVIDDDDAILRGVARLLKSHGYAVETFSSPSVFLEQPIEERRGCILVDLQMPGMNGLQLQQALTEAGVHLPVVFISGAADVPAAARAFKGGALDFLTKPFDENTLLDAVKAALARDAQRQTAAARRKSVTALFETLTPREREVCMLVARGLPNKQIAFELGTVEKTVKVHRARVLQKLAAKSVADLVRLVDELH